MQELFHDEQTQSVSTTVVSGQSQTRSAQYSRNYRKNPEKNRKINEDRRRNYKMKKDGIDNVSSMFESVALPGKAEPQTIEKAVNKSDKPSLSESQSDTSRKSEPNEAIIKVLEQGFKRLESNFDNLQSEIKFLQGSEKPATPALPINNEVEQQASVSGIASANNDNLAKNKTIAKRIIEKLPAFGLSILILTFLGFNTYFLVSEQQSLYMSMSYSAGMALMIAILSEASLILLSTMASWTSNLERKIGLTTGMIAMLAVMVGILDSSAKSRVNSAARKSEEYKNLIQERETLRDLREPILARIKKLSPEDYPTLIKRLSGELETPPNGYSFKIQSITQKLASIKTAEADTSKMIWQRRVSLLLNLLFSSFLGFLWTRDQVGVLTKIGRSVTTFLHKPCET